MKYIISESRNEKLIFNYLDKLFDVKNIHHHHPHEYDDFTEDEIESIIEFYEGDYSDDDFCFRYYACDYFKPETPAREICPEVALEYNKAYRLNSLFGNLWEEPFKKWFEKNFSLPVKTVS